MILAALFSILFIQTGDSRYNRPMRSSIEATYASLPEKQMIDGAVNKIKDENKVLTSGGVIGYAFIQKKEMQFTTTKLNFLHQENTRIKYDRINNNALITFNFIF